MPAFDRDKLEQMALKTWTTKFNQPEDTFPAAWREIRDDAEKMEAESDAMSQRAHEGTCQDPARAAKPWHSVDGGGTLMESHARHVREELRKALNERTPWMLEIRAKQKAEKEAAEKAEAERIIAERQAKQDEFKIAALKRFVDAGGDPAGFDKVFPSIWEKHLQAQALGEAEPVEAVDTSQAAAQVHQSF